MPTFKTETTFWCLDDVDKGLFTLLPGENNEVVVI